MYIQFALSYICNWILPLPANIDSEKNQLLRDYLDLIDREIGSQSYSYDELNLQLRSINAETLCTWTYKAILFRKSQNHNELHADKIKKIIDSFEKQFYSKRLLWNELEEQTNISLHNLLEKTKMQFYSELSYMNLGYEMRKIHHNHQEESIIYDFENPPADSHNHDNEKQKSPPGYESSSSDGETRIASDRLEAIINNRPF
ncbi:Oidioi.mRNA.OKI2018_I69.YSR.g17045.t1.cds [Oikopleura dioica]|uniref:Oidioi.mRNA.OKI2018_I69.YSR.g17045.t1.cds n=1 Tax=Oikopleura dioica TaxID=34765 RepID=A0ABN7SLT8_OIKDI|nr:Oidioi.mRNA.OKI2018_I69.YSR.g17045.t1.cds [Oikopleura dioica]